MNAIEAGYDNFDHFELAENPTFGRFEDVGYRVGSPATRVRRNLVLRPYQISAFPKMSMEVG